MRQGRPIEAFLLVPFGLFLLSGNPQFPVAVEDSSGHRVVVDHPPRRIVSTIPSNTEILYALGLKDRVVGVTRFCGQTCDTKGKRVIGGWVDPNFKVIRWLEPDLIFAFGGLQKVHLARFREIAPTYFFEPRTVEETLQTILRMGKLTGQTRRAEEIVRRERAILARVERLLSSIRRERKLRVARLIGDITVGRRCFTTDVIRCAGGVNVFADVDEDYFQVDFRRLAQADPDVLILQGENPNKVKAAYAKKAPFKGLRAVKAGRILVYSCDDICHPNAAIAETVEKVARGLYPDLFE